MSDIQKRYCEKVPKPVAEQLLEPVISIGTAAKIIGLSVSMLRKYESHGLMIYHRTESGHRMLSHEDIERIKFLQKIMKVQGLNLTGIRRLLALIPCWELKPCTEEERENCSIMEDSVTPCWLLPDSQCSHKDSDCRTCVVYRFSAYCTEDLKSILHGRGK